MYAFHFPADIAKVVISPLWTLGDIFFTNGVSDYIDEFGLDTGYYLMRHLAGDYGLIYDDELDRRTTDEARREGRSFVSMFHLVGCTLKVVTTPSRGRTVACLSCED